MISKTKKRLLLPMSMQTAKPMATMTLPTVQRRNAVVVVVAVVDVAVVVLNLAKHQKPQNPTLSFPMVSWMTISAKFCSKKIRKTSSVFLLAA